MTAASVGLRHGVLLVRLLVIDPDRPKAAARDAQRQGTIVGVTSPNRQIAGAGGTDPRSLPHQ
jgi:hypothetical protein